MSPQVTGVFFVESLLARQTSTVLSLIFSIWSLG